MNTKIKKIALFGGVYNNHLALRQACELALAHDCEKLFQLGDLGGFGPFPNKVFPILKEFNVQCIQGNYEESLANRVSDCGCGYTHPRDNYYAQLSYDYTNDNLSEENRNFLKTFPKRRQVRVGGAVVHLCHGSPRRVNEFLWETATSNAFVLSLMRELKCDIVACTHTGLPWKREVAPKKWIVNVGALGRPANDGQQNVWYVELSWKNGQVDIQHIPVHYDWKKLAEEMTAERLPSEFIETITTGWWTTCLEILPEKERARGRY
ncbi:MAG: hypothetical protein KCHDKBKB_02822 [Elusimicrobia bacterium]|nr:hypothetical protein [Elusimicrobiota bacterium]